jgi:hypothetical protein
MTNKKMMKVDLTLVKRLVAELELVLTGLDELKANPDNNVEFIVQASKASGLATGIMQEAALLTMDIQALIQGGTMSADKS